MKDEGKEIYRNLFFYLILCLLGPAILIYLAG